MSQEILDGYFRHCGVKGARDRANLEAIRADVAQKGWWERYQRDVASTLMDRAWLESKAMTISSFDIAYLPGLLQLPDYAESLMRRLDGHVPERRLQSWIEMRSERQRVLAKHRAVKLNSIIDEQLLRRRTGGDHIMRDQLDFLVEASERPNVTIRVLPADMCIGVSGSFEIFTLHEPYPRVGYVATAAGDICVEDDSVDELADEYARLEEICLPVDESIKLMVAERDAL